MSESVPGVLYIITSPDGHVQAAEADFTQDHAPAYTQEENQERRAKARAWGEVIRNHASGELCRAIMRNGGGVMMDRIRHNLIDDGWRAQTKVVSMDPPARPEGE